MSSVESSSSSAKSTQAPTPSGDVAIDAEKSKSKSGKEQRAKWDSKMDFIVSCIGFAVGLGNIWRFPYLCYKNGGGSFLIPYLICLILVGIPIFLMETALGQLLGRGFLSIWSICPGLKGVGYASLVLLFWTNAYYIVIISWSLYYLVNSMRPELPWANCTHVWNTNKCRTVEDLELLCSAFSKAHENATKADCLEDNAKQQFVTPVQEYWNRHVLQLSSGIDETGSLHVYLLICLALGWALCFYAIYKGIQSGGKMIYFSALFPYVCLIILFIRGITLDGALNGLAYYFTPNLSKMADPMVWNDALSQIFFSYGLGIGAWIALSSYNEFRNNVFKDTLIVATVNGFTALFSGAIVFCIVGYLAHEEGKSIDAVVTNGSGLTFIVYPSATLTMPWSHLWTSLFFLMMNLLGIGSQFVQLESFFTGLIDEFSDLLRSRRTTFIIYIMVLSSAFGLLLITESGMYWFELFNTYAAAGFALLFLVFGEVVAVFWFYGADRFAKNCEQMMGSKTPAYLIFCWKWVCPITCMAIFILSLVDYSPPIYQGYVYPGWAIVVGWLMAVSSMIWVPGYFLYKMLTGAPGGTLKDKWSAAASPNLVHINKIIAERDKDKEADGGGDGGSSVNGGSSKESSKKEASSSAGSQVPETSSTTPSKQ